MIRRIEGRERLADDAAQARLIESPADLGLVIIHVGDGGDAGLDGFERAEERAHAHHLRRHELALHGQHIAEQPVVHILAEAAEQGHRQMGMGIDHARHDHVAARIDDLGPVHLRRLAGAERPDRAALDVDPPALDDAHRLVDGQQAGVRDQDRRHQRTSSAARIVHCSGTGTSFTFVPASSGFVRLPLATTWPAGVSH